MNILEKTDVTSNQFFYDGLSKIRFYLDLISSISENPNEKDLVIELFKSSIDIMNNLKKLRERNHSIVEILEKLLKISNSFDKSDLIKEIITTLNKIIKENDPDLFWIIREIRKNLKESSYSAFLKDIKNENI